LDGQQLRNLNAGAPVASVAVRPDGQRIAGASNNNTVRLWNVANNQQLAEMKGDIRSTTLVATLTQRKTATETQVNQANTSLKTAQDDLPTKDTAAKTAADALVKAEADVTAKAAALATAESAKAASEKVAIEMAALAQKAANAMEEANQTALAMAATAKLLADKAAQARAAATADQDNQALAQAATAAEQAAATADAQAKAAETAKAVPTKAAADAATAANDAATKALATNKPYADALAALNTAQDAQRQAASADEIAKRDLERAKQLVPSIEADVAKLDARLKSLTADLEVATKAAADAEQPVHAIAFSPDNFTLATGGQFGAVHTWDADTGVAISSYVGHGGPVHALAYTSNEGIISGSDDKSSIVWELKPNWRLERTIGSIDDPTKFVYRVRALAFSEDGQLLATGSGVPSRSGEVKVWKVDDGSLVTEIPEAHIDEVLDVAISRDGEYVASAGADKFARMFQIATGKQIHKFEGHTNYVLGVTWRHDGKTIASCGADDTIMIWDTATGDRLRTISGFNKQVFAVKFVGQTNNVVSCAGDRTLRMHNTDNGGVVANFAGTGTDFLYSLDLTPNRTVLVVGGHDSVLRIWNGTANGSQPVKTIEPPRDAPPAETVSSAQSSN
jgi:WD40 repeat protein